MNTMFSHWRRRVRDIYHLHGRRLFIVDFFTLVSWLIRCASEAVVGAVRMGSSIVRWTGGVLYRTLAGMAYCVQFFARAIGRTTVKMSVVSSKVLVHTTKTTARVATRSAVVGSRTMATVLQHAVLGGARYTLAVIDFLGEGTITLFTLLFRVFRWISKSIWYVLAYGFHIVILRPFLFFINIVSRLGSIVLGKARHTGNETVEFLSSFHPLHPPVGWNRTLISFIVMVLVLVIPFPALQSLRAMEQMKEETITKAMGGVDAFSKAQDALINKDVGAAHGYFTESYQRFLDAEGALTSIPPFFFDVAQYIPGMGKEASEGKKLLEAGKELSLSGQYLTAAFDPLLHINEASSRSLLSLADDIQGALQQALPHLENASGLVQSIDSSLLADHQRALVEKARVQLPLIISTAQDMNNALTVLHNALGADQKKRYLVILQNNTEIRATGGFIGSFALVDIDRGIITAIEIPQGGSYDLQGQLSEHVISPAPLHLINPRWQFQDANWFPDFPTSAKKLEWFYEKSGGSSVDGVIAINAKIGEAILKLTGPIPMPAYNKTITAENFLIEIQKSVEIEYDRAENKPKKLISDLIPEVITRLSATSSDDYGTLVQTLVHSLSVNDIQVFLNNETDQEHLNNLGLGGYIKSSPRDYTMIVDTNIAGGKTDGVMRTKAHELVVVNDDGTIDVTTRLWREHTGVKGDLFTGVNNVNYMRMYVPKGSHLISAQGFNPPDPSLFKNPALDSVPDVDLTTIQGAVSYNQAGMYVNTEFDKTVFGNWTQTKPGTTSLVEVRYRLPFTVKDLQTAPGEYGYVLLLQRQSASSIKDFSFDVVLPSSYNMKWTLPKSMTRVDHTWHWQSSPFQQDEVVAFQFYKE